MLTGEHNMSFKNRFRSKRVGYTRSNNANGQGVTSSITSLALHTCPDGDRETLMGIRGNLSVRPSTATGAAFFSIQLRRFQSPNTERIDPQDDSDFHEKTLRLWDKVVSFDAGATETRLVDVVSKKRRKLYSGDIIEMVKISNVSDVAILAWEVELSLLKSG